MGISFFDTANIYSLGNRAMPWVSILLHRSGRLPSYMDYIHYK